MGATNLPVSDVLFGQIRSGILALLYGRPDQSFYLRQMRDISGPARELSSVISRNSGKPVS